jgi:hypothetical protein
MPSWFQMMRSERRTILSVRATLVFLAKPRPILGQNKYGETPGAVQRHTLLLRDFKPRSMLQTAAHAVQRARHPVIDGTVDDIRAGVARPGSGEGLSPERRTNPQPVPGCGS